MLPAREGVGLRCEGVISTSFGCPYEGRVAPERVLEIAQRLRDAGAQEIGFGDTTGMANPVQVGAFFELAFDRLEPLRSARGLSVAGPRGRPELTAHFHNTRGQGLANVLAALQSGVSSFESSFGELGGCPVPAGATGNIASEDLVSMLHEMGISTGVDLEALIGCAAPRPGSARPLARLAHAGGRPRGLALSDRERRRSACSGPSGPRLSAAELRLALLGEGTGALGSLARSAELLHRHLQLECGRSAGRAEASITRLASPTATWELASSSSTSSGWPAPAPQRTRPG